MERNTRVLLFAVLIILLLLVALNFRELTGKVSLVNSATIDIKPKIVECAIYDRTKVINIEVDSGAIGLDRGFYLYENRGEGEKTYTKRISGSSSTLCNDNTCKGKVSKNYRLSCDELSSGEYLFKFTRDNYNMEIQSPVFTLKHKI